MIHVPAERKKRILHRRGDDQRSEVIEKEGWKMDLQQHLKVLLFIYPHKIIKQKSTLLPIFS